MRNKAPAFMVLAVALAACRAAPSTTGTILAEGWDTATDVVVLDIPADCPAQRLEYAAWQVDDARLAQVDFVASQMGDQVHTTATGEFADYADGAADWTLKDDAVYALTARGINARWRFAVICQ